MASVASNDLLDRICDRIGVLPEIDYVSVQLYSNLIHTLLVESSIELLSRQSGYEFLARSDDPERPHDMYGMNNRTELGLLLAFSLNREMYIMDNADPDESLQIAHRARDYHRSQTHHRMFNGNVPPYVQGNNDYDRTIGAIDVLCATIDPFRFYQSRDGEVDEEVLKAMLMDHRHGNWTQMQPSKLRWLSSTYDALGENLCRRQEHLMESIQTLGDFMHIEIPAEDLGIGSQTYRMMKDRTLQVIKEVSAFYERRCCGQQGISPAELTKHDMLAYRL
jgi:hypothetical protein